MDQTRHPDVAAQTATLAGWRAVLRDLAQMVRFYSRLPLPRLPFESDAHASPDFTQAPRMLPFASLVIGLPSALTAVLAAGLGLPPLVAAALAVAVAVLACGAFHEDGLADTFDGLGGGWTPERRLEIMKDSRIGSYGGAALVLALILRVAVIAALIDEMSLPALLLVILAAASVSRTVALMPIVLLPPARADGYSSTVGRPTMPLFGLITGLSLAIAVVLTGIAGLSISGVVLGLALALALSAAMTLWSRQAIKGQTGDIAGACQQFSEIAFCLGLLITV